MYMVNKSVKLDTRKIDSFTKDLWQARYPPLPTYMYLDHSHLPLEHLDRESVPLQIIILVLQTTCIYFYKKKVFMRPNAWDTNPILFKIFILIDTLVFYIF